MIGSSIASKQTCTSSSAFRQLEKNSGEYFNIFMNMLMSLFDPCWNLSIRQVSSPQVSWSHLRLYHQLVSGLKIFVLLLNQRWDLSLPALPTASHEKLSKFLHYRIFGPKNLQHDCFHKLYNNESASESAMSVLSC